MFLAVLFFLLGDLCLQQFSHLPQTSHIFLLSISMVLLFLLLYKFLKQYALLPLCFLCGFIWALWYANSLLAWQLPKNLQGKPLLVSGYIASIPVVNDMQTSFIFSLNEIHVVPESKSINQLIKLSLYSKDESLQVGDKRRFVVRLKRIHAIQSPGALDFEAWAFLNKIRATGYILPGGENTLLNHHWYHYPINQIRAALLHRIQSYAPKSMVTCWLPALMIGERINIPRENWQVLQKTGTNHLMAIAGLHIGIVTAFMYFLTYNIWRRLPNLPTRFPAQQVAAIAALLSGILYSALAGFSLPTQRACIMLTVLLYAALKNSKFNIWNVWALAILIVLTLNPFSIWSESFYLSFLTLALIFYSMQGRLFTNGWWWKWGRVQWVVGIGLFPITLLLYKQASFISFIANSIAIPWLSFLILPFCFLSCLLLFVAPSLAFYLLLFACKSLNILWLILTLLANYHYANWLHTIPTSFILAATIVGFILLLFPHGFPGRILSLVWLLPFYFYQANKPAIGEAWFTLLDVGQGLATVVQTRSHVMVYDTGPKYKTGIDMGENVVLPYLLQKNISKIDTLIISHGDNDHIGGLNSLLKVFPMTKIVTSVPDKIPHSIPCLRGMHWVWDGVNFTVLYPSSHNMQRGNDSSCVLRIESGQQSILLTGDIQTWAEKYLTRQEVNLLPSKILIAPHHGSKTSALRSFIESVHPAYVFYSTGYRNRYHFPNQKVVTAYSYLHARQYNTVDTGSISIKIKKDYTTITSYRLIRHHYWFDET